jgi:molybdopterin-binding protein
MVRGGVLLRTQGGAHFIPASVALAVAPRPIVAPVPGAPEGLAGVAFCEGAVVPVLSIGPARSSMVLCAAGGELVGVVGAESVQTVVLEEAAEAPAFVERESVRYALLDVPGMCEALQSEMSRGPWSG